MTLLTLYAIAHAGLGVIGWFLSVGDNREWEETSTYTVAIPYLSLIHI